METQGLATFNPNEVFAPMRRVPLSEIEQAVTTALSLTTPPFFFDSYGTIVLDESVTEAFGQDFGGQAFGNFSVTGSVFDLPDTALPSNLAFIDPESRNDVQVVVFNDEGQERTSSGDAFSLVDVSGPTGQSSGVEAAADSFFDGGFVAAGEDGFTPVTVASNNVISLTGGASDNILSATGFAALLDGGAGNDRLEAIDAFVAQLNGGAGDDQIFVRQVEDVSIDAGAGDNTIEIGNLVRNAGVAINDFSGDTVINFGESNFGNTVIAFGRDFDRDQLNLTRIDRDSVRITLAGESGSLTINGLGDGPGFQEAVDLAFGEREIVVNLFAESGFGVDLDPSDDQPGPLIQQPLREPGLVRDASFRVVTDAFGRDLVQPGFGLEGPGTQLRNLSGDLLFQRLDTTGAPAFDGFGNPLFTTETTQTINGSELSTIALFENGNVRSGTGNPAVSDTGTPLIVARDETGAIIYDFDGNPLLEQLVLIDLDRRDPAELTGAGVRLQNAGGSDLFVETDASGIVLYDTNRNSSRYGLPSLTTDALSNGTANVEVSNRNGSLRDTATGDLFLDAFGRVIYLGVDPETDDVFFPSSASATRFPDMFATSQVLSAAPTIEVVNGELRFFFQDLTGDPIETFEYQPDNSRLTIDLLT